MNSDLWALLAYRMAVLACGFGAVVLGYRLFRLGVFERAGELKANWGGGALLLKAAAPGTFFALFGSAVIAAAIWKGFSVETTRPLDARGTGSPGVPIAAVDSPEFQNALQAAIDGRALNDEEKKVLATRRVAVETRTIRAK